MARAARSLDVLRSQIDQSAPGRSRISDGGIADARHLKAGTSDHIANSAGVFHARDFTHDPVGGFDSYACADRLLAAQDPRLKYLISRGRIGSGPRGVLPGVWRRYSGANQHDHHVHVSVVDGPLGDDTRPWAGIAPPPPPDNPLEDLMAQLSPEEKDEVMRLVRSLNRTFDERQTSKVDGKSKYWLTEFLLFQEANVKKIADAIPSLTEALQKVANR